jgi:hypothetical protein
LALFEGETAKRVRLALGGSPAEVEQEPAGLLKVLS